MSQDVLFLWYLGDRDVPRLIGKLKPTLDGDGATLEYSLTWRVRGLGVALSEDLPLTSEVFQPLAYLSQRKPCGPGAVDDAMIGEWGERVIKAIFGSDRLTPLERLLYAGDHRFGALGVSPPGPRYAPLLAGPLPRLEDAQTLCDIAGKIMSGSVLSSAEKGLFGRGGSALAGTNPKAVIEIDGDQWLIKFSAHQAFDSALVEHATLTLAAKAGISVVETRVLYLAHSSALLVRRFDRGLDAHRIDCISAGTAIRASHTKVGTSAKGGYPALAQVLMRNGVTDGNQHLRDARELFVRMVFNILVGNTDDHEKNHSLLVEFENDHGRVRLAPAYDVLPTCAGKTKNEFICGLRGHDPTLLNAMSECTAFGLLDYEAAMAIRSVASVVDTWRGHFAAAGVSAADIAFIANHMNNSTHARACADIQDTYSAVFCPQSKCVPH